MDQLYQLRWVFSRKRPVPMGLTAMTTSHFSRLELDEATQILGLRLRTLTAAGYDLDDAVVLASHVEIDLDSATELVRRGCPSATAVRILV